MTPAPNDGIIETGGFRSRERPAAGFSLCRSSAAAKPNAPPRSARASRPRTDDRRPPGRGGLTDGAASASASLFLLVDPGQELQDARAHVQARLDPPTGQATTHPEPQSVLVVAVGHHPEAAVEPAGAGQPRRDLLLVAAAPSEADPNAGDELVAMESRRVRT